VVMGCLGYGVMKVVVMAAMAAVAVENLNHRWREWEGSKRVVAEVVSVGGRRGRGKMGVLGVQLPTNATSDLHPMW
jgi:hypothetical protein